MPDICIIDGWGRQTTTFSHFEFDSSLKLNQDPDTIALEMRENVKPSLVGIQSVVFT